MKRMQKFLTGAAIVSAFALTAAGARAQTAGEPAGSAKISDKAQAGGMQPGAAGQSKTMTGSAVQKTKEAAKEWGAAAHEKYEQDKSAVSRAARKTEETVKKDAAKGKAAAERKAETTGAAARKKAAAVKAEAHKGAAAAEAETHKAARKPAEKTAPAAPVKKGH